MLLPGAPGAVGTGSHRRSMAPVFDSQHAVVTSQEGAEQFCGKCQGIIVGLKILFCDYN